MIQAKSVSNPHKNIKNKKNPVVIDMGACTFFMIVNLDFQENKS
jgi:hypothetical protein